MLLLMITTTAYAQSPVVWPAPRALGLDRAVDALAVTDAEWAACVDAEACSPARRTQPSRQGSLVRVTYAEAVNYCRWSGTRLPRAEDIEALGVKVPGHLPTEIDEWVSRPPPALPLVRRAGTRDLEVSGERSLHGVRCLWQVAAADAPAWPDLEPCLGARRRVDQADTPDARGATEDPWTCAGLSIAVEFPRAGPTWLDHWTGRVQTLVAERSDGSYALSFRRSEAEPDDAEVPWYLAETVGTASIKRKGPLRTARLRDLEPAQRATWRIRLPEQRETRLETLSLQHDGWDIALVAGPGTYGGRPDLETAEAFFRSVLPSLVGGWRLALPAGGWLSVPPSAWSPQALTLRPDRVRATFEDFATGAQVDLNVARAPRGPCGGLDAPPTWAVKSLGDYDGRGWRGEIGTLGAPSGAISGVVGGCSDDATVRIELRTADGSEPDRATLELWANRLRFPERR